MEVVFQDAGYTMTDVGDGSIDVVIPDGTRLDPTVGGMLVRWPTVVRKFDEGWDPLQQMLYVSGFDTNGVKCGVGCGVEDWENDLLALAIGDWTAAAPTLTSGRTLAGVWAEGSGQGITNLSVLHQCDLTKLGERSGILCGLATTATLTGGQSVNVAARVNLADHDAYAYAWFGRSEAGGPDTVNVKIADLSNPIEEGSLL